MSTNKKIILLLLLTGVLSSSAFFFFPEAKALGYSRVLALAFAVVLTQLLAVWYFLSSLGTFKKGLRIAYYLASAGIFAFSFSQFVLPLAIFVTITSTLIANALVVVPYLLGGLLMYAGMYKFARLLEVHYLWRSIPFVLVFSLATTGAAIILPHPTIPLPERTFDLIFGTVAWSDALILSTTILAYRIRQTIGSVYKNALSWFAAGAGVLTLAIFHEFSIKIFFESSWYVGDVSVWIFILTGIVFLKAGMAFKEAGRQVLQLPANASYIDTVIGVAQLVSKPADIDTELDKVRAITAREGSATKHLSPSDEAVLRDVYLRIENYLTTNEPLHAFTKEGLRAGLPDGFLKSLS
ncbi:MAG: hypothetical protein AAB834_03325 [Patescibacteria group bacterium]